MAAGGPTTILLVAANPASTTRIALDEEVRAIEGELRMATRRSSFRLRALWATRPIDLLRGINRERPAIVHFAGHGERAGIVLSDDGGGSVAVAGERLAELLAGSPARLVVLNGCSTDSQSEALVEAAGCVIAMSAPIGDAEARRFSQGLYAALGEGRSVRRAFDQASALLDLGGECGARRDVVVPADALPRPPDPAGASLRHRPDVDPDAIEFADPGRRWGWWIAAGLVLSVAAGPYLLPRRGDDASPRRTATDELVGRAGSAGRDASPPPATAPGVATPPPVPDAARAASENGAVAARGGPYATAAPRAEVCDLIDINDVAVTRKDDAVLIDVTMQNNGARIASVTRVRLEIVEAAPPRMVVAASAVYPLMVSRRSNELAFSHEVAPGGKVERLQLRTGATAAYAGALIKAYLQVKYGRGCWARSDRFTFIAPSRPATAVGEPPPSP